MPPVARASRRYVAELGGTMVFYMATVFIRAHFAAEAGSPALRLFLCLVPILPILLVALVVWRFLQHTDEYMRSLILKALAFSAGATAVISLSWMYLKDAGVPALPFESAGLVMTVTWAAAALFIKWRENRELMLPTLRRLGLSLLAGAAGAGAYALWAYGTGHTLSRETAGLIGSLIFILGAFLTVWAQSKKC